MSIDLSAFNATFFEEAQQLLGRGADILLEMQPSSPNPALLDELHRCVHGVVGGAATLGFSDLAVLARSLEHWLEGARVSAGTLQRREIMLCGQALAQLQSCVSAHQDGHDPDVLSMERICDRLRSSALSHHSRDEALVIERESKVSLKDSQNSGSVSGVGLNGEAEAAPVRVLRFKVSRLLVGADLLLEHVMEDLARLGQVSDRVHSRNEKGDRLIEVDFLGQLEDEAVRAVVEPIAEPGSIEFDSVEHENRMVVVEAFLPFDAGDQAYLIERKWVVEVRPCADVLRLPGLPPFVVGVVGLGDEPVVLIDTWMAMDPRNAAGDSDTRDARIILVSSRIGPVALLVDAVGDDRILPDQGAKYPRALRTALVDAPVEGFVFVPESGEGCRGRTVVDVERLVSYLEDVLNLRSTKVSGAVSVGATLSSRSRNGTDAAVSASSSSEYKRGIRRVPAAGSSLVDEWDGSG